MYTFVGGGVKMIDLKVNRVTNQVIPSDRSTAAPLPHLSPSATIDNLSQVHLLPQGHPKACQSQKERDYEIAAAGACAPTSGLVSARRNLSRRSEDFPSQVGRIDQAFAPEVAIPRFRNSSQDPVRGWGAVLCCILEPFLVTGAAPVGGRASRHAGEGSMGTNFSRPNLALKQTVSEGAAAPQLPLDPGKRGGPSPEPVYGNSPKSRRGHRWMWASILGVAVLCAAPSLTAQASNGQRRPAHQPGMKGVHSVVLQLSKALANHDAKQLSPLFSKHAEVRIGSQLLPDGPTGLLKALEEPPWSETTPPHVQQKSARLLAPGVILVYADLVQYGSLIVRRALPLQLILRHTDSEWRIVSLWLPSRGWLHGGHPSS